LVLQAKDAPMHDGLHKIAAKVMARLWPDDPLTRALLVDDARCFGQGDYPSIEGVREMVADRRPEWTMPVADDVIRIHGPAPLGPRR